MRALVVVLALGASGLAFGEASAQDYSVRLSSFQEFGAFDDYNRGRNVSVLQRERPEYEAQGVRSGAFLVYPRADVQLGYSDNIYARPDGEKGDGFIGLAPSVNVNSTWSRHQLNGQAGAALRRYFEESSENRNAWYLRGNGRIDIVGDSYVAGGAALQQLYEDRTSSGAPLNAAEPVPFLSAGAYARGVYQAGRVRSSLNGEIRSLDYHAVDSITGGRLSQNYRDRTIGSIGGRGEFALTPDAAVFGLVSYTRSDYEHATALQVSRDSDEVRIMGGANFDLSALLRGEVGLGYIEREYDAGVYDGLDGFTMRAQIEYFPTQLTTLTLQLNRNIEDSADVGSGGYFVTSGAIRVDHELRRNLLLNAAASYEQDEYEGFDREDEIITFSAGANYFLSPTVGVGANLSYAERDSSGIAASLRSYDVTSFSVTLVLQR